MKGGMGRIVDHVAANGARAPGQAMQINTAFPLVRGDMADAGGHIVAARFIGIDGAGGQAFSVGTGIAGIVRRRARWKFEAGFEHQGGAIGACPRLALVNRAAR